MSNIIRVEHAKNYTCISNEAIRDKRLSLKARGLHHLLLSYPDNWRVSIEHLAAEASDKDARTAIQTALKELEALGYISREQIRGDKGRIIGWEHVVRELPQAGFPIVEKSTCGKSVNRKIRKSENPDVEKPNTENPSAENQWLINTDSYEIPSYELPIPPTPQGEVEEKKVIIASLEKSGSSSQSTDLCQPNQPTAPKNEQPYPEPKNSAAACDNSDFVGKGNIAPDGKTRSFDQVKGTWKSIGSDPWMESSSNPISEFKSWVAKPYEAKGDPRALANAAAEIRNNYQRASDLWDAYQAATHRQTEPQQPRYKAAPDTLHQAIKPIKLSGKR